MTTIPNGAPMTYFNGIRDESTRPLPPQQRAIPSHFAKQYFYAKTGPTTRQLVGGNSAISMYGSETFDESSKYANHSTVLTNLLFKAGSQIVAQRVLPADIGPRSTIRLSLDVLRTQVPVYERNADGSIRLDTDGLPIATGTTVAGAKIKWVASHAPVTGGVDTFGLATQTNGDQVDIQNSTQSVRIPFADIRVPHYGSDGNNVGIRIWAPTNTGLTPMDTRMLTDEKFYPFEFACMRRKDELSTPKLVSTVRGGYSVQACLKPGAVFRATRTAMYVGDTFIPAYQDLDNPLNPPSWGPFGEMYLYQNNIDTILDELYRLEAPRTNEFSDFGTAVDNATVLQNKYLFNLISAVSSQNVPYTAVQMTTSGDFVHLSNSSVIYAKGGSDGTMSDSLFAELVSEQVLEYANPNSPLTDNAMNPESVFYDSGFPLQTKLDILSAIAIRKDTVVGLSTHDVSGPPLTTEQETSMAIALATRARLYPESTFYGTATARVFIMGRSGTMLNSEYKKPLPVLLDLASKYAQYMGADDGRWKADYKPDVSPRNIVSSMKDFNATFTPAGVRINDWSIGLNWLQAYDDRRVFIPAVKTVYQDDTSVLTSVITAFACARLQRIGEQIWRDYVGRSDLSKAQLRQKVEEEVLSRTNGKFDDRFVFRGEVVFTKDDDARGYTWHLDIHMYANNMLTVQVLSIVTHRMEDLEAA